MRTIKRVNRTFLWGFWPVLVLLQFGCGHHRPAELPLSEYKAFLGKEEALVRYKVINDIKVGVRFLPVDYLVIKEISSLANEGRQVSSILLDSLRDKYNGGLHFLLTLEPNSKEKYKNGLIFSGISSRQEYAERINVLNFHTEELVNINLGQQSYFPVLSTYESVNDLGGKISLLTVFESDVLEHSGSEDIIDFVFDDPYWGMGINHFEFDIKALMSLPKLSI
jgi:hypothetical protein